MVLAAQACKLEVATVTFRHIRRVCLLVINFAMIRFGCAHRGYASIHFTQKPRRYELGLYFGLLRTK